MKIDDIKGESVDAKHPDEIEVLSWTWGMTQAGTAHSGPGAGKAKVSVQDLSFEKYADKSSPNLIKLCCNAKPFANAKLTVRKAGGGPVEYIKINMKDGLISAVSVGGAPDDERLKEHVTLNFASFTYEYTPQTKDGSAGGAITAKWNIATNTES
jgi:type VI secretion system secreted protein Hcp